MQGTRVQSPVRELTSHMPPSQIMKEKKKCPPKYYHLETENVTLLGEGVFADVIKDLEMRSSWIIWLGRLIPVTNVLVRAREQRDTDTGWDKAV